jgi:hypothetical protein
MATGTYQESYETPISFRNDVIGEWHIECFPQGKLQAQSVPYSCQKCTHPITHNEEIFFAWIGSKPSFGYIRPEERGHELYLVVHAKCFYERALSR